MTLVSIAALLFAASTPASGVDADAVLAAVRAADLWAFPGAEVRSRAVVRDASGAVRTLRFAVRARRDTGGLRARIAFTEPDDVAGAVFLLVQHRGAENERWLYLPELGRPRRVSEARRDASFMGTHLSYADLDGGELRAAVARSVAADRLEGVDCWRVEARVPGESFWAYGRIVAWVRRADLVPVRLDLHNRAGVLAKTIAARELKRIGGSWVVTRSVVVDRSRGGETELVVEGWSRLEVAPEELTPAALGAR